MSPRRRRAPESVSGACRDARSGGEPAVTSDRPRPPRSPPAQDSQGEPLHVEPLGDRLDDELLLVVGTRDRVRWGRSAPRCRRSKMGNAISATESMSTPSESAISISLTDLPRRNWTEAKMPKTQTSVKRRNPVPLLRLERLDERDEGQDDAAQEAEPADDRDAHRRPGGPDHGGGGQVFIQVHALTGLQVEAAGVAERHPGRDHPPARRAASGSRPRLGGTLASRRAGFVLE